MHINNEVILLLTSVNDIANQEHLLYEIKREKDIHDRSLALCSKVCTELKKEIEWVRPAANNFPHITDDKIILKTKNNDSHNYE